MSPRRVLFAAAPAVGVLLTGLLLGEWSQRQAEGHDDLVIPTDAPGLKYEFSPGGTQNSHGYNERELPMEKPAGTLRVAALGDSVTHGAFVPSAQAWPRQLEGLLVAAGVNAQVLNFGVYGYDTESIAAQLAHRVLDWQPDLLVYAFYVNDPMPTELVTADGRPIWVGTGERDFTVIAPGLDDLLHTWSALFRRFEGAKASRAIADRPRREALDWERFGEWMTTLAKTAEDTKLPLIELVVPPHVLVHEDLAACNAAAGMGPRFCEDNLEVVARATAIAADRHLPTVDGVAAYRAAGETDLHGHADDPHHPSPEGHRRLAVALAPVVLERLK